MIPAPKTCKKLNQLIGLIEKWMYPTKGYQECMQPLQKLSNTTGNIEEAIQKHSREIKIAQWYSTSQVGSVPVDPTKPMMLFTSRSQEEDSGFGAVLYSESWSRESLGLGRNRPIAIDSIQVPKYKSNQGYTIVAEPFYANTLACQSENFP